MIQKFVSTNLWSILTLIFVSGGAYSMLMSHQSSIESLELKIIELESNKVSSSSLELKEETLTHMFTTLKSDNETLSKRMRNAIDDDLKPLASQTHVIDIQTQIQESRLQQAENELKSLWKFTNKFLEEK